MPGDPKECRQHALTCVRLAQTSPSPQAREDFASLANTWLGLATDLEQARAVLDAMRATQTHWDGRPSEPSEHLCIRAVGSAEFPSGSALGIGSPDPQSRASLLEARRPTPSF